MKFKKCMALVMAVGALSLFALAGCGNSQKYSETFTGSLSEEDYTSQDEVINGFFENEINGNTTEAENIRVVNSAAATKEEISSLNLGADVESVTKLTVSYELASDEVETVAMASSSDSFEQLLYAVKYRNNVYRYFVPPTPVGGMISKSYFDDVFSVEKYINCTITEQQAYSVQATGTGMGNMPTVTVNTSAAIKMTEEGAEMTITQSVMGTNMSITTYVIESENGLVMYLNYGQIAQMAGESGAQTSGSGAQGADMNNMWVPVPLSMAGEYIGFSFDSLSDLARYSVGSFLDHTYFEKTENGFMLSSSKYMQYVRNMYADLMAGENLPANVSISGTPQFAYTVTDGRINAMTSKLDLTVSASASVYGQSVSASVTMKGSASCEYTDFGKTRINFPENLHAMDNYMGELMG